MVDGLAATLQNQLFSGGLLLMLTGALLALCRNAPVRAWGWILRRATITVDVTNDDPLFEWLSEWLSEQPYSRRARLLTATVKRDGYGIPQSIASPSQPAPPQIIFTPAPGNHLLLCHRRLVWLTRERQQQAAGGDKNDSFWSRRKSETFKIRVIGRDQSVARSLLEDARAVAWRERESKVEVFVSAQGYWNRADSREPRQLSTVFLPDDNAERIAEDVREFLASREWYMKRGVPYRRGYLFHGLPGSGKTSLITALAGELRMSLYVLNLSDGFTTDSRLNELLANVSPHSMVLLEDIDSAFNERQKSDEGAVTFSGLLNALDGAASKEGNIVFMTTNHLDRLDPALIRPGRADVHLQFNYATFGQAERMFRAFYEKGTDMQALAFAEYVSNRQMSTAEVQNHLLRHKLSPESATRSMRGEVAA